MLSAAVIGYGAWGSTFATILADVGNDVTLWGRDPQRIAQMEKSRTCPYLPQLKLAPSVRLTADLQQVQSQELLVVALPSDVLPTVLAPLRGKIKDSQTVVSLTKGVNQGRFASETIAQSLGIPSQRVVVISGPNLASEIAQKQPAACVVANADEAVSTRVGQACDAGYFRPYYSKDPIGCEVAGVTKNVIALAVGAAMGMGYGHNTCSTLVTRGLAEMTRLGLALGARGETFLGLAGIGDLTATCASTLSRNLTFGINIGKGMTPSQALEVSRGACEGVKSCREVAALAQKAGVEMPITDSVVDVIFGGGTVQQMGKNLLGRARKRDGVEIVIV